ncbi:hypothetical protein [Zoogloea sp.]|uniref:hypothetical protein n=1 Tax=Zoogloea sp. TaxID=49181 RepID=UPI0035B0F9C9
MNARISPDLVKAAADQTADPEAIVRDALARQTTDKGAIFADDVIEALATIRSKSEASYTRLIANVKGVRTKLDKLTKPQSQTTQQDSLQSMILDVARDGAEYAHTAEGEGVALVEVAGHREAHMLTSPTFDRWLRGEVFDSYEIGIPDYAMTTTIATLKALGTFKGAEVEVHRRVAKHDGAYWIDLCDDQWRAIKVQAGKWEIVDRAPVLLGRAPGMRPLPEPAKKGNLALLWRHLNIPKQAQPLVLAWMLDSLRHDTPYPVLELVGEMGSSKSTTQRRLRALIDPHQVPLRGAPKCVEDLHIAASNAHVVSLENLSHLNGEQQDALCILSTGGGYATRQLYTNGGEHVMQSKRPVMINGINAIATQPDLIERTVSVELPTIEAKRRQDEQSMEVAWEKDYPAIFTGMLDLFAKALERLPAVVIPEGMAKRMIDFQRLGEAITVAQGGKAGEFSKQLDTLHGESALRGLESYGVAVGLQVLAARPEGREWEGTYLQLLTELGRLGEIDRSNWPKSPRHLSSQIKRIAPGLRRVGIRLEAAGRGATGAKVRIVRE